MGIYRSAARIAGNHIFFFLLLAALFLGMPISAHASGFECDPNPNPDSDSFLFTYDGPAYSSGNLLSLGFGSVSTSSAGYYVDVRAYDDSCNLITSVSPGGVLISSSTTGVHVRFVSTTEFDIVDDATGAILFSNEFRDLPPYVRVVVRIRSDFTAGADVLDTAALTLQSGAMPPVIEGQAIAINPVCPARLVGHGRYIDYFDGNYEKPVYIKGLLRVQLRLTGLGLLGGVLQTVGADPYDAACNPISSVSEHQVYPDQSRYSRYFSFRMSDATHWQLWDDERETPLLCVGCAGTVPSGTASVSFMVYNSGDGIFPHYIYTTPYPPTDVTYCAIDCNSNVLFLPGIEASRLYDTEGGEKKLWEPAGDAMAASLLMNPDGTSVRSDIYTRDIIDNAYIFSKGNIYWSFINTMNALKARGKIADWAPVPYDWRLSIDQILASGNKTGNDISYTTATSSPYVLQELRRLAASSRTGKVTIIAHSNGGLVAKALMQEIGPTETARLIDKVIFVAVPQVGTPQALVALLHGQDQELPGNGFSYGLTASTARTLGDGMPGPYILLPSASYFAYVDTPVATFATSSMSDWVSFYGGSIHSQDRMHAFLTDTTHRITPATNDLVDPSMLSNAFLTQAEHLHALLDSWAPPTGVHLIQIAGWGMPSTISGIDYARVSNAGRSSTKLSPRFTIDGDGTVVTPSALWTSTTTGAADYWVDLNKYNNDHKISTIGGYFPYKHANILETDSVLNFISDQVTNSIKSLSSYIYLSSKSPVYNGARLRYSLHSPLTLNLYDDQGRHTGVSTTTGQVEEEIPGTYYIEFGDVKYVFTDASSTAHIVMDGYASGTFTFNADQYTGDTLTASTTFKDIPTTPQTHVTMGVQSDITTLSSMHVDENGDGVTDFNLTPKLNDVVTLPLVDTMAPTTTVLTTGMLGTNSWYRSAVRVTFNATDTGSGVKSTLFSLDGAATTTGTTTTITTKGIHLIRFYSDDNAGNVEQATSTIIKIDMSPPEASISMDATTHDLGVVGIDDLSSTTVTKTATTTLITDQAGNTTTLRFQKTYSGTFLALAKLASIQYGTSTSIALPSAFLYVWDAKQVLVSQTVTADSQFITEALYDKKSDKTTIIVLRKGIPIQTKTLSGLVLMKLLTSAGVMGYGW